MPAGTEPSDQPGIGQEMQNATFAVPAPPGTVPPQEDQAFDAWLREHLSGLHRAVLSEPVPDRLLRVLGLGGAAERPAGN